MPIKFRNAPSYSVELGHVRIETSALIAILERCRASEGIRIDSGNARIDGLADVRSNPEYLLGKPTITLPQVQIEFRGETVLIRGTANDDIADKNNVQHIQRLIDPYRTHFSSTFYAIGFVAFLAFATIVGAGVWFGREILPETTAVQAIVICIVVLFTMQAVYLFGVSEIQKNVVRDGSKAFWRVENPILSAIVGGCVGAAITYLLG